MRAFHDRDEERQVLADTLTSPKAELIIVYGRRGVGKSALLERVCSEQSLPHLFYRASRRTLPLQLAALTEAAREAFPAAFLAQPFASTEVLLDFLVHLATERKAPIVLVIDELPYLAEEDPGLMTVLQHWWDANKECPQLKVLLAGSTLSFMESQVLDVNAPLYNRRTGALKLEALDYADAARFFPHYSPEDRMTAYAILGGMPGYLEQWDAGASIEQNVKSTVLRRGTYLSEEPEWVLLAQLRKDVTYGSILQAVAQGARRPSDIARAIGKDSGREIGPHLETLIGLGFVVREVPVTERLQPRSRSSLYWVSDHYLDFWYRYVDPSRSLLARGLGERIWESTVAPTLHEYVSRPAFERACRQHLWRALKAGKLPSDLLFTEVGSWWGAGDVELDVVALGEKGGVVLAGSCKWTTSPMDVREYSALLSGLARSQLAADDPYLALFSRAGFSPRLKRLAGAHGSQRLLLIDLKTMYSV